MNYTRIFMGSYVEIPGSFNIENNVLAPAVCSFSTQSNTLENGILTGFQQKMVEKIVSELNGFENVFYEIQNEPWADDPQKGMLVLRTLWPNQKNGGWFQWAEMASENSLDWQKAMAKTVVDTETKLANKHLIAQNYNNFKSSLNKVDPNVSIFPKENFTSILFRLTRESP